MTRRTHMAALSIDQPYASLIFTPQGVGSPVMVKQWETRSWAPPAAARGGRLVIASTNRQPRAVVGDWNVTYAAEAWTLEGGVARTIGLPRGAIVGSVIVLEVQSPGFTPPADQLPYGHWGNATFAWTLTDARRIEDFCPWCEGGNIAMPAPCPVCDGVGHCSPVPVKGRQRVWRWQP